MSFFGAETIDIVDRLLEGARQARTDPESAQRAVLGALAAEPDDFTARLAAYKFYFYNHRYAEAAPHASYILGLVARRLNVSGDWRAVEPGDAAFGELEEAPSLYLQALIAWGYCQARLGFGDAGREAIAKAAMLDPRDRFGARRLLDVIEHGAAEREK